MKTLNINKMYSDSSMVKVSGTIIICALLWHGLPFIIQWYNGTAGMIDSSIWLLLLFTIISFLGLSALAWWLLQRAWVSLGLPGIQTMVSQFKHLTLWQQFALYWASFALLLLAAVLSLVAVF